MRKTLGVVAAATVLLGGSLGVAGVASAEPLDGTFTATVTGTEGGANAPLHTGWLFNSCGTDCRWLHKDTSPHSYTLRLQGDTWSGVASTGECSMTIDADSLTTRESCGDGTAVMSKLSRG